MSSDTASVKQRRVRQLVGLVVLALVQLVGYQNCGADFSVKSGLNLGNASLGSVCEADLEAQFESSYWPFVKQNCATCHTGAGPGTGAFASSNPDVAYQSFLLVTSSMIDQNATNSAHAGGYTGPQNNSAITVASQEWAAAESTCSGGSTAADNSAITTSKTMNATTAVKSLTWNLDSELAGKSVSTGGATLTVSYIMGTSADGSHLYYFSDPKLQAGSKAVEITGMMVRINGQEQTLGSTWSRLDMSATAGQLIEPAPPTSNNKMIMEIEYDAQSAADTLSIDISSLTTN